MTKKGRILTSEGTPVTAYIEFVLSEKTGDVSGAGWVGNFAPPSDFSFADSLNGGIGKLELSDGTVASIFLLTQEKGGRVTFHCPGAPKLG